ncbi:MAG: hypothetical protein ACJ8HJ_17905 [Massilia sp.]
MEIEHRLFILSIAVLAATASVYGMKFLGKGNYLLGVEWLVVALSAASILVFALGGVDAGFRIAYFCDAFARGCGGPVVIILGLMAVTHGYRPLAWFNFYLFASAAAGTAALVAADAAGTLRPAFYLAMWSLFSLYLVCFIRRLAAAHAYRHAVAVGLVLVSAQAIAGMYDFYPLPGDDERLYFHAVAGLVWSFLCVELYYAYCALERAAGNAGTGADATDELEKLF